MLKALELSGFKSFADKTRFEFPPGITVVVGPNGSGKSNIVDALKWVLGEQSAKSLRGKDMSDVIFKGSSGPGSRKPAGAASVTLYLDNADGRLLFDAPEVSVTRRVYRSGESEYLINGAACRLKDIRDLFRGTGIGTDAYSLIEQGKVERMLQASAKDRRAIFEEAAGISRFKAKKVEAERRLERVQGNLVRLADIVEEVGSRYRAVKNQASRAARYRELSARLQELRVDVGSKDYRALEQKIQDANVAAAKEADELELQEAVLVEAQEATSRFETRLEELTAEINRRQEAVATIRDLSIQLEARLEAEQLRRTDLSHRIAQNQSQLESHDERLVRLKQQAQAVEIEWQSAEQEFSTVSAELEGNSRQQEQLQREINTLQSRQGEQRERLASLQADDQNLGLALGSLTAQLESSQRDEARHRSIQQQLAQELNQVLAELAAAEQQKLAVAREAERSDSALRTTRESTDGLEQLIAERQNQLAEKKSALAGLAQREKVIAELEKKLDLSNAGLQELLRTGRQDRDLGLVGMVADLIQVNVRHAALIDAALGPVAQYLVVRDDRMVQRIAMGELRVPGRVGILSLDRVRPPRIDPVGLADLPGVVGPALSLVEMTSPGHNQLIEDLLGQTWIVESLATALALRANGWFGVRLVTLDGELVESDGTVMAGARAAVQGIVSRRSELRALAEQNSVLTREIAGDQQTLEQLRQELAAGRSALKRLLAENQQVRGQMSELSASHSQLEKQRERLAHQNTAQEREIETLVAAVATFASQFALDGQRHSAIRQELKKLTASSERDRQQLDSLLAEQSEASRLLTQVKVRVARSEQRRLDLGKRRQDLAQQSAEATASGGQWRTQIDTDQLALEESLAAAKTATEKRDELLIQREEAADALQLLVTERSELDTERKRQANSLQKARSAARQAQEQLGEYRLRINQFQIERNQLAERLREDYQIDVASLVAAETGVDSEDRARVDTEITDLRQKIGALGTVNLQALAELEELEQRYQHLDGQYQDLVAARDALLKIIHRINNDSRKLFVETLEAIRTNFQKLFRQTFGGGQADIMLEEGVDVLEAGVEIIATPPGKPKFNNSLLSGGEKALTAVSLLMAIFQFRPSPFCVLDEVDAPFDEANIGRFIDVLKSFLGWTRFVIVTHSKKTMTAASTLYGVTMQESGVSKRVSVRFEDVSEDGQISRAAIERSPLEVSREFDGEEEPAEWSDELAGNEEDPGPRPSVGDDPDEQRTVA